MSLAASIDDRPAKKRPPWEAMVPFFVGAILILAALSKLGSWIILPHPDLLVVGSWSLTVLFVLFEALLGVMLICGISSRVCRNVALATFLVFASYSGWKFTMQSSSCGCFGFVPFPPLAALLLDLGVIAALFRWKPTESRRLNKPAIAIFGGSGLVLAVTAYSWSPVLASIANSELQVKPGEYVLVQLNDFVGQWLPLAPYLTGPDEWKNGRWKMFFFREGCNICEEQMNELNGNAGQRIAFVEMPPISEIDRISNEHCLWLTLSDTTTWLLDVPAVITLENGIVLDAQ